MMHQRKDCFELLGLGVGWKKVKKSGKKGDWQQKRNGRSAWMAVR